MRLTRPDAPSRPGAIAPLAALLLIPLLAMVAFAIDMGWITHTQNQLQSAADAAALAGAGQLPEGFVEYYLPGQTNSRKSSILAESRTKAATFAKLYAGYNEAGGVSSLTLLDGDIEFGLTDANGNYTASPAFTGHPNTVKVTLRRDSTANTPLGLFFAKVLNINSVNLTATASAAIHGGSVNSFQTSGSTRSRILPMTFDVNHWNEFMKTGKSPDGGKLTDSSGNPQIGVYPSIKFTGNFGQLSLDQSNDGASVISNWINNGVRPSDLQALMSAGLLPLSSHNPNSPPDWNGNPGLKTSTIHTAADNVGGVYLMPLFKPVNAGNGNSGNGYQAGSGQGSNYYYTIVEFVGIKITQADNKEIKVTPTAVIDPNAILSGVSIAVPPTSGSAVTTTFSAPKLIK